MNVRRVAVTGGSGLIGRALLGALRAAGWSVLTIGRGAGSDVRWDPSSGTLDARALDGTSAVVHLAGEPIAVRWTEARRRLIMESRTSGTALLAHTIAALSPRPLAFVSASAIGYYGEGGESWLDEGQAHGEGFLASVCVAWERAADAARDAGIRVVHPRLGVVLATDGGALAKLLPPFRLGLGGPVGSGAQWMSWISRADTVRAIVAMLDDATLDGAVNVVAPEPVTNAAFTKTLGHVLHRPAIIPVPAIALRTAFGEMAEQTLLVSQRVRPARLQRAGFAWEQPSLEGALRAALRERA
ncbi:MAG: TIGR01777 family protein [Gemmatimonadetes bacterium]|nr:TIGR01777 family protein [Gemmatimonadota bacterium]MBI3568286.1 TIGR01777 family protein [Gemmatimonadota bacterium]